MRGVSDVVLIEFGITGPFAVYIKRPLVETLAKPLRSAIHLYVSESYSVHIGTLATKRLTGDSITMVMCSTVPATAADAAEQFPFRDHASHLRLKALCFLRRGSTSFLLITFRTKTAPSCDRLSTTLVLHDDGAG